MWFVYFKFYVLENSIPNVHIWVQSWLQQRLLRFLANARRFSPRFECTHVCIYVLQEAGMQSEASYLSGCLGRKCRLWPDFGLANNVVGPSARHNVRCYEKGRILEYNCWRTFTSLLPYIIFCWLISTQFSNCHFIN